MFNYSAGPSVRRGQSGLKRKKAGLRRMFFSSLRDYAAINVMMASRSQKWSLSYRIGEVNMKLYVPVSRILREENFSFSLLPNGPIGPIESIERARLRLARLILLLSLIFAVSSTALSQQTSKQSSVESIPTAEFARMIREFSEDGGYFMSDNFTSNETSYLHVVDKLRELGVTGGAYIGVGPEQNFTYIAKVRPRIAFIVDIRRQAMIQHLMYKAIFQLSPNRAQFLARLLSKPLPKDSAPPKDDAPVADLIAFFGKIAATDQAFAANLAEIKKTIQEDFQFPLSDGDRQALEYVYKSFRENGLDIAFRLDASYYGGYFPSFKDLALQTDLNGKTGNFLAGAEDYNFIRSMQKKNLIIPIVGDFSGPKALGAVGDYLRKNGLSVASFYTSNVEQYLFDSAVFDGFAKNVRKLPIDDKSVFIRAVFHMRYTHPARKQDHMSVTLLQRMKVFLKDFDDGLYPSYRELIVTNYIAP
jgi:hypothetical protein